MKKTLAILLVVIIVISMAACSNNDTPKTDVTPNTQETGGSNITTDNTSENTGNNAFDGTVTEKVVRDYKVADTNDFKYEETDGGIRITGYLGTDTIVVIPEQITGKRVVSIAAIVFGNDSSVRGVYVPSGVTELEATFGNNHNLEVVIWESAEIIGPNSFNNCPNLHTVILGKNLISLGGNAFANCMALEEIYISPNVKSIDPAVANTVFFWCDSLTIRGEAGSFIESFCSAQGLSFKVK